jgi:hypothetical protein
MRGQALKDLYRGLGPRGFTDRLIKLLDAEKPLITPDDVSLRELWEAVNGPLGDTLGMSRQRGFIHVQEAVDSSVFPNVTGVLIAKRVIDGYEQPGYIGDQLVANMPSRLRVERVVGFTAIGRPGGVDEGMPYPHTGLAEKFCTTQAAKEGYMIEVTEEAVFFDQTGQLLMRAQQIGTKIRLEREKVIIDGVQDANTLVYWPQGAAEALYRTAAGTNATTVNKRTNAGYGLVDWTDIDEATQLFAAMVDEAGDKIVMVPTVLLVPPALKMVANRICRATELRTGTASLAEVATWANPVDLTPLSSVLLSSSTTWYMGDPKRQFVWQDVWPLQVLRADAMQGDQFDRDIVAKFKTRFYGGIGAIDDKFMVQTTLA